MFAQHVPSHSCMLVLSIHRSTYTDLCICQSFGRQVTLPFWSLTHSPMPGLEGPRRNIRTPSPRQLMKRGFHRPIVRAASGSLDPCDHTVCLTSEACHKFWRLRMKFLRSSFLFFSHSHFMLSRELSQLSFIVILHPQTN